jgi:hypothetical protein
MQKSIFYTAALLIVLVAGTAGCANITSSQAVEHYNKGVELSSEGKYDEAIAEYDKAIANDQNYANAYLNRGYCYLMKKQYPIAIADYSQAINLNPRDPHAYNGRGAAYLYTKQYELAMSDFEQSAKLDPNQDQVYKNLEYTRKMLASSGGSGSGGGSGGDGSGSSIVMKTLTGEWVRSGNTSLSSGESQSYGYEMFDGGSHWFYDIVLNVVEDNSGNFRGTWTQTLLKVSGPATSLEGGEQYWRIGVPSQISVSGMRSGEAVQLDFGGRVVHLKFTGDNLSGEQKYYDYGSPVTGTPKFYEELHPELGSLYIEWTYTIDLKRK